MNIRQFTFCAALAAVASIFGCNPVPQAPQDQITSDDDAMSCKRTERCTANGLTCGTLVCKCDTWVEQSESNSVSCDSPAPTGSDAGPDASPSDTGAAPLTDTGSAVDSGTASSDTGTDTTAADSGAADTGSSVDSSTDTAVADTGSSDTGVTDTGAASSDTGTVKPIGTLVLHVRLPRWGTSHSSVLKGFESPMRSGSVMWGSPLGTSSGTGIDLTVSVAQDSTFTFNGYYDGDTSKTEDWTHSFVDMTGTVKVAIWGTFNGAPIARPTTKSNGSGGYNLVVTAAPSSLISSTDEDGDGFAKSADCNDSVSGGQAFYPYQVEAPEDSLDFDCNGKNDPPRAIIRMNGVSSVYDTPVVHDVTHWGTTYSLSWNSTLGAYTSSPIELDSVPPEFYIQWGSMYDSTYDGSCRENATVQIYRDLDGTLIPTALKVAPSGGTCHRFATL